TIRRPLALEGEPLAESTREVRQRRLVVRVVAVSLTGQEGVEGVVEVVVPLRLVEGALVLAGAGEIPRFIAVVLQDEMHEPVAPGALGHGAGQLPEHVRGRGIRRARGRDRLPRAP